MRYETVKKLIQQARDAGHKQIKVLSVPKAVLQRFVDQGHNIDVSWHGNVEVATISTYINNYNA